MVRWCNVMSRIMGECALRRWGGHQRPVAAGLREDKCHLPHSSTTDNTDMLTPPEDKDVVVRGNINWKWTSSLNISFPHNISLWIMWIRYFIFCMHKGTRRKSVENCTLGSDHDDMKSTLIKYLVFMMLLIFPIFFSFNSFPKAGSFDEWNVIHRHYDEII